MYPVRRQISPHAAHLRRAMTNAERAIWEHLRNRQQGGHKFRRQVTIGPFVADFVCLDAQLIVELDGGHHSTDVDAARSAFLEERGYRIARFRNHEVAGSQGCLAGD